MDIRTSLNILAEGRPRKAKPVLPAPKDFDALLARAQKVASGLRSAYGVEFSATLVNEIDAHVRETIAQWTADYQADPENGPVLPEAHCELILDSIDKALRSQHMGLGREHIESEIKAYQDRHGDPENPWDYIESSQFLSCAHEQIALERQLSTFKAASAASYEHVIVCCEKLVFIGSSHDGTEKEAPMLFDSTELETILPVMLYGLKAMKIGQAKPI